MGLCCTCNLYGGNLKPASSRNLEWGGGGGGGARILKPTPVIYLVLESNDLFIYLIPIHILSFDFYIHSLLSFTNKYCSFVSILVSELNF